MSLDNLIGQSEDILKGYNKEGDSNFSYYIISSFEHSFFSGEKVFVFCENNTIVGFSVKRNNNKASKEIEALSELYGTKKITYESDFGIEYQWKTAARRISLSHTKTYKDFPQNTFYSEALLDSKLIVV